jgi:hypothetical protein
VLELSQSEVLPQEALPEFVQLFLLRIGQVTWSQREQRPGAKGNSGTAELRGTARENRIEIHGDSMEQ